MVLPTPPFWFAIAWVRRHAHGSRLPDAPGARANPTSAAGGLVPVAAAGSATFRWPSAPGVNRAAGHPHCEVLGRAEAVHLRQTELLGCARRVGRLLDLARQSSSSCHARIGDPGIVRGPQAGRFRAVRAAREARRRPCCGGPRSQQHGSTTARASCGGQPAVLSGETTEGRCFALCTKREAPLGRNRRVGEHLRDRAPRSSGCSSLPPTRLAVQELGQRSKSPSGARPRATSPSVGSTPRRSQAPRPGPTSAMGPSPPDDIHAEAHRRAAPGRRPQARQRAGRPSPWRPQTNDRG